MKSGRNWKKRYFALEGSTLNYYKKPDGQLRGSLVLEPTSTARNSNIKPNAFEVKTSTAALIAYAATERERDRWVSILNKVVQDLQSIAAAGSSNSSGTTNGVTGTNNTTGGGGGGTTKTSTSTTSSSSSSSNNNQPESRGGGSSTSSGTTTADDDTYVFAVSGTTFEVTRNYKLIKPIGQGAYGVVISALDQSTRKKVAIKKVTKAFEDTIDAKRILRELCLLRHFDHENIVSVMDICRPRDVVHYEDVYIVSELMEVRLLCFFNYLCLSFYQSNIYIHVKSYIYINFFMVLFLFFSFFSLDFFTTHKQQTDLHRVIYSKQSLTDEHVQYFLYQLLRGLKYMHSANVLHRDLK